MGGDRIPPNGGGRRRAGIVESIPPIARARIGGEVAMMYLIPGPVCGERTLATAQKLSERPNRAGIISICPLHNIVGV